MDEGGGGWLWLLVMFFIVVLGVAIWYGYAQWRSRRRTVEGLRRDREAVKDVYSKDTK